MKSWHIVVLDGCKIILDREVFTVKEAKEIYEDLKKKYAETHPHYAVKREWYQMVIFPPEFVATKYPGYFWNINDEKLYSIKVTGMLKPLAFQRPNRWNHGMANYKVSVNGRHRYLYLVDLLKLTPKRQKVPIYNAKQLALF